MGYGRLYLRGVSWDQLVWIVVVAESSCYMKRRSNILDTIEKIVCMYGVRSGGVVAQGLGCREF